MATPSGAKRSAFESAPHVRDPSGSMSVWYTRPPGAVVRLTEPTRVTIAHAEWLLGAGRHELALRFPDEKERFLVLDLSRMTEREPAARALILKRAPEAAKQLRCTYLIPPLTMNRLQRMSIHAAAALLRTLGIQVEIRATLEEVREQLELQRLDAHGGS